MSSLKMVEKMQLEELFAMSGGGVMDLNHTQLGELLKECVDVDIHDARYALYGDSKAKRLRAFCNIETDSAVGTALNALLEYWAYKNPEPSSQDVSRLKKCKQIVERLLSAKPLYSPVSSSDERRIWGENNCFRIFISHKNEDKKKAAVLKEQIMPFGVSCFVAHEDIRPTKEWQSEIERALGSMDALVALVTSRFHESYWTNQEVGFAMGRSIPIVPVKLESIPQGFLGKFQALSCSWENIPCEIVKLLIYQERMLNAYIDALRNCEDYSQGNMLAVILPSIKNVSVRQADKMAQIFNNNDQLQGSFGFNGSGPDKCGRGLAFHLTRIAGQKYIFTSSGQIKLQT